MSFVASENIVSKECDVGTAVTAGMRARWRKFRDLSDVLCGKTLSIKLKGMLYNICIRAECWTMNKVDIKRMQSI